MSVFKKESFLLSFVYQALKKKEKPPTQKRKPMCRKETGSGLGAAEREALASVQLRALLRTSAHASRGHPMTLCFPHCFLGL